MDKSRFRPLGALNPSRSDRGQTGVIPTGMTSVDTRNMAGENRQAMTPIREMTRVERQLAASLHSRPNVTFSFILRQDRKAGCPAARGPMPNGFAYLMLFAWPLVAQALFRAMPVYKALIWTIMAGYLVLPSATGVKLPMLPLLDKHSIPVISAFVLCWVHAPPSQPGNRARLGVIERALIPGLLVLLVSSPFLTVMTNTEPLFFGPTFLPGLRPYDALSMISGAVITILPFLLARRYLNTPEAHREILRAFAFGGLAYSLPALLEVRLSPQLHVWVYGFFPHNFIQHIRAGGFRPVVFLNHGLMIGILFCLSTLAALILWREARREGKPAKGWLFAALWLMITLVLAKSVGALAIALTLSLVIGLGGQRLQVLFAAIVAMVVLFYPMLRGAGHIPVDSVYDLALSFSEDRAQSLKFRLDNEDELLAHANEKPFFGWGGWGRNHIFDAVTGRMTSVVDGIWVLLIGVYGWAGYIAYFGLLTLPILLFARHRSRFGPSLITPGLIVLLSGVLIDFLPNAGLVPYVWMIAGALTGFMMQPAGVVDQEVLPQPDARLNARLQPLLE